MGKKAARNEVKDLFKIFGLDEFMFKYPFQLSGGMRQRAALMRTYVDGKSLLLLDEPFGGLDAITKAKMQDWLLEVQRELKATILFITHDIEEAIYLSDRVYIMTDRPSEIKEEIEVDLPRPRNRHMIQDERFTSLKEYLLEKFL
jgi:ABC-type nitrate/sulfonate/bicarbonate transport system ATPase subunit